MAEQELRELIDQIARIPPFERPANIARGYYSAEQQSGAFYEGFQFQTFYLTETGTLPARTAGPMGYPSRILHCHSGGTVKITCWATSRLMQKPILPHWDTGNPDEFLRKMLIIPYSPILLPGGENFQWAVEGVYIWDLRVAVDIDQDDPLVAGKTPMYDPTAAALQKEGYTFSKTLLKADARPSYLAAVKAGLVDGKDKAIDGFAQF